jgi:hypothetical protein
LPTSTTRPSISAIGTIFALEVDVIELYYDDIWKSHHRKTDDFVTSVTSKPDAETAFCYDGIEFTVPADPLGVLNVREDVHDKLTPIESALRAYDMELLGYGWLSGIPIPAPVCGTAEDKLRVAGMVEARLKDIVWRSVVRDEFAALCRYVAAGGTLSPEQQETFRKCYPIAVTGTENDL